MPYLSFLFLFLFLILLPNHTVFAQDFPDYWHIQSTYKALTPYEQSQTVIWKFSDLHSKSTLHVRASDSKNSLSTSADLFFNLEGLLYKTIITHHLNDTDKAIQREYNPDAPALFPDSIVPVDWLNLNVTSIRDFPRSIRTLTRHSTDLNVSRKIRIIYQEITVSDAVEQGMLHPGFVNKYTDPLSLFILLNDKRHAQEEVLRQLWAQGDFWWLFETNGFRTSLRLPPE